METYSQQVPWEGEQIYWSGYRGITVVAHREGGYNTDDRLIYGP